MDSGVRQTYAQINHLQFYQLPDFRSRYLISEMVIIHVQTSQRVAGGNRCGVLLKKKKSEHTFMFGNIVI